MAGKVVSVDLAKDRDGKSKGYASVQFSGPTEAINAIGMRHCLCFTQVTSALSDISLHAALFHGQMLCDRPMKLKMVSVEPALKSRKVALVFA